MTNCRISISPTSAFSGQDNSNTETIEEALHLKANIGHGKEVYELCGTCHMENGWGKTDGSFPVLAGQHVSVIIKQLSDIESRNRENPTMFPLANIQTIGGVQAIADVAAYIASLPPTDQNGKGDGKRLAEGQALYERHCTACHGNHGEGNDKLLFPKIQGQHYRYLARQLKWIRDGFRKNGNPAMFAIIKDMSDADLEALADAVSRLMPPDE
ncbi:MAG: c-type cytochrome [bacterium]